MSTRTGAPQNRGGKQANKSGGSNSNSNANSNGTKAPAKPAQKPAVDTAALAAQEAARKEARLQRQAQARADADRKRRQATLRKYAIIGLGALVVVALVLTVVLREMGKPGQGVDIMADRYHLNAATDPHTPYSTDPPTSGPHTNSVPAFTVYATPIPKEEQVHALEDGAVVINYQPALDTATVDKLAAIARVYQSTPGKSNVLMSPYPGLSNPIVLTSWGRIDRLDTLDEARLRTFVDAFVNIDHHEGKEGQRIP